MSDLPRNARWKKLPTLERISRVWGDAGCLVRVLATSDSQKPVPLKLPQQASSERFRQLLLDSRLITPAALEAVLQNMGESAADETDSRAQALALAEHLVAKRLLSSWQAEKVLAGKYKGFILANYRIQELLGSGKLGSVYRAEHQMMRRSVAIKILMDKVAQHTAARDLFFQRARQVAVLDHKNLVHVFDMGQQRGVCYVVMEFVSGYDLQRLMRRCGPLPLDMCASIVAQVCQGMLAVHAGNESLGGLEPSDVVLDPNGVPHLLTLRLAEVLGRDPQLRQVSEIAELQQHAGSETGLEPSIADGPELDRRAIGQLLRRLLAGLYESPPLGEPLLTTPDASADDIITQRPDAPGPLLEIAQGLTSDQAGALTIAAAARQLSQWLDEAKV